MVKVHYWRNADSRNHGDGGEETKEGWRDHGEPVLGCAAHEGRQGATGAHRRSAPAAPHEGPPRGPRPARVPADRRHHALAQAAPKPDAPGRHRPRRPHRGLRAPLPGRALRLEGAAALPGPTRRPARAAASHHSGRSPSRGTSASTTPATPAARRWCGARAWRWRRSSSAIRTCASPSTPTATWTSRTSGRGCPGRSPGPGDGPDCWRTAGGVGGGRKREAAQRGNCRRRRRKPPSRLPIPAATRFRTRARTGRSAASARTRCSSAA